jgi:hypothetical protein
MADGVDITAGSGTKILTDDTGANGHAQVVKLGIATDGSATLIPADGTDGLLVNLGANNDVTVTGAALTALQLIDDPVAVLGTATYSEATTKGMIIGAVRRDADTTLVDTTNEIAPLQVDANGRLKVEAFSGEALPITDNSGSITVDAAESAPLAIRPIITRISVAAAGLDNAAYAAGETLGDLMTVSNAARASGGSGYIVGVSAVDASDTLGALDVVFFDSSVTLGTDNAAYAISDADALKIVAIVPLAGPYDIGNNRVAFAQNISIPFVCSGSAHLYASFIARGASGAFPNANDITLHVYVQN